MVLSRYAGVSVEQVLRDGAVLGFRRRHEVEVQVVDHDQVAFLGAPLLQRPGNTDNAPTQNKKEQETEAVRV